MGCLVFLGMVIAWILASCCSILAAGLLVYALWLLGRFLIG
jgi:hypothetical protein